MLQVVEDQEKFNDLAWHVSQSWQWGEFRRQTPTVKRVIRLGSFENGRLKKTFQIFFHFNPNLPSLTHLPNCVAYLPRSAPPTSSELAEITAVCLKEGAVYLTLEPVDEVSYPLAAGQSILPAHTLYLDLTKLETSLLAGMHEKTRYNIHLAEKKGVIVREDNSPEGLENFIKLLTDTESRQGFYSHYPDYYRKLWQILRPAKMVYLLSAYIPDHKSGAPVASIMLFRFKDYLYYPYGGSDPQFREFMAPNLLHWEAVKLGKKLGCKTYDMWGSYRYHPAESDPWWGIYRFKKGFGGEEVSFPAYEIPFKKSWYQAYKTGNKLRWTMLRALRKISF